MNPQHIFTIFGLVIAAASLLWGIYTYNQSLKFGELSIVPFHGSSVTSSWLPETDIDLIINNEQETSENLKTDFFLLYNDSNRSISSSDFEEEIRVSDTLGNIISVQNCSDNFYESCSNDTQIKGASDWKKHDQGWNHPPFLINKKEQLCVAIIVRKNENQSNKINFSGRIKDFEVIQYKSAEEYREQKSSIFDVILRHIDSLKTLGNFVAVFAFMGILYLLIKAHIVPQLSVEEVSIIVFLGVVCASIPEIFLHLKYEESLHYHDYFSIVFIFALLTWPLHKITKNKESDD